MEHISIVEALGLSVLGMLVVFFMLILLMAVIALTGKLLGNKKAPAAAAAPAPVQVPAAAPVPAPAAPVPAAPAGPAARGSCGPVELWCVDERTAATLMAIVANTMGAPLCELRFKSIRKVK